MSALRGQLPGRPARNGIPRGRYYTYQGPGYDQFTEDYGPARLARDITAYEGIPYTGYDTAFSEVDGARGRKPGGAS